jgi:micrococcal nuclease
MYEYKATVIRVVDGDTVDLDIDLGMRVHVKERVRIAGIDTPEKNSKVAEERTAALAASAFLQELLKNPAVMVRTQKDAQEKYGRYLATIINFDGVDCGAELIKLGHAVVYFGGAKS